MSATVAAEPAADPIAQAEAELAAAAGALQSIYDRLDAGDPGELTAESFFQASNAVTFAERKLEGAREAARQADADAKAARVVELLAEIERYWGERPIETAFAPLAAEIDRFVAVFAAWDGLHGATYDELMRLRGDGAAFPAGATVENGLISTRSGTYRIAIVKRMVADAFTAALNTHYPSGTYLRSFDSMPG